MTSSMEASELLPQVYEELRIMARRRMNEEAANHTLQTTALVHEVYLRLAGNDRSFASRGHFFRVAAEAMRRILIEHARAKGRIKRKPPGSRIALANVLDLASKPDSELILALDDAIQRLEQEAPQTAAVVRQRFFCGLSIEETAEVLELSPRTVNREWTFARAWLFRELEQQARD